jgi:signal transduction histidine kinase/HAMP domain-containing protein/ActR/RegA family two-component response regulator
MKALRDGDFRRRLVVAGGGIAAELASVFNEIAERNQNLAGEVARVRKAISQDGQLTERVDTNGVMDGWSSVVAPMNGLIEDLLRPTTELGRVLTAVARGDLSQRMPSEPLGSPRGEIGGIGTTVNHLLDQLSLFADEVTRVSREVGTDGRLGGQAEVPGVAGTWRDLTNSVNFMANNLTTQLRAIAAVATAVAQGDPSQKITVKASGEVAQLKDDINRVINNLEVTTTANDEQDWLKASLARLSGLMQGHRDLAAATSLVLRELAPLVHAEHATFFLARGEEHDLVLERTASYGYANGHGGAERFRLGESLVGQAAKDKKTIMMDTAPPGYLTISSGLGSSAPTTVIVLPVLFEGRVLGVIELASVNEFSGVQRDLLEQLKESMGLNVNTLMANSRTEALLIESQRQTQELRQLQAQQEELQRSNKELAEKAALLAMQNRDIETKNTQIESARQELEQRARQLIAASAYKSEFEFMANMSHELRTPLNSSLLFAKLLGDNVEGNLTPRQVEYAQAIHSAGSDLLQLINNLLDLSKVESGRMEVQPVSVSVEEVVSYVESLCRPLVAEKGLFFSVDVAPSVPASLETDEDRLQQVLRNLLSNAVKFTDQGTVRLHIKLDQPPESRSGLARRDIPHVAFAVGDSGIGIPEDKLQAIFGAFPQTDGNTNRHYGGNGLGLTISRKLAYLIGADLHVRSSVERGSTFILYVPVRWIAPPAVRAPLNQPIERVAEHADPAEGRPETRSTSSTNTASQTSDLRFHGEKVLIVDDDPHTVFALTTLLERHGLRVVCGENGMAGLQKLTQEKDIALVLMDVMMPVLDGHATTQKIRHRPEWGANLPIIALTAKAMKGDDAKSLAAGATSYITKPVDIDHLLHVIAKCLHTSGARQR